MDNLVYDSFVRYFHAVEQLGYISDKKISSLLALEFFYRLLYEDYRGYVSEEDYHTIDKALNCLYGSNCLIPYPTYLKMGRLHLGEVTELASRVKNLESSDEVLDRRISDNDLLIADNIKRIDELGSRADSQEADIEAIKAVKVVKEKRDIKTIPDIDLNDYI